MHALLREARWHAQHLAAQPGLSACLHVMVLCRRGGCMHAQLRASSRTLLAYVTPVIGGIMLLVALWALLLSPVGLLACLQAMSHADVLHHMYQDETHLQCEADGKS